MKKRANNIGVVFFIKTQWAKSIEMEQFSTESRKTKITTDANSTMCQSEYKITCTWRQARENARAQVAFGFGLAFHWLKKWREFCWPITERSKVKPKQMEFILTLN